MDPKNSVERRISEDMSIGKVRQLVIHSNPKSGVKPIFDHVDVQKLPKNPEVSTDTATSVGGVDLLSAMFATADDDKEDLGDVSEPEQLKRRKAAMSKEDKPRGTTGIKIHERITWWQDRQDKEKKTKKKSKEDRKRKKKDKKSMLLI